MTIKVNGHKIICNFPNCGRIQDLPSRDRAEAVDLAAKLLWWVGSAPIGGAAFVADDYCPEHTVALQASGKLGPRNPGAN